MKRKYLIVLLFFYRQCGAILEVASVGNRTASCYRTCHHITLTVLLAQNEEYEQASNFFFFLQLQIINVDSIL